MSKKESTLVIKVEAAGRPPFKYKGVGEHEKCVGKEGDIDLHKAGNPERVCLEFELEPREIEVDGVLHSLEFQADRGISFAAGADSHRGLRDSPFEEITVPANESHKLRVLNANHKKEAYKYTLRVRARVNGGAAQNEWEHDPLIKNTGGGYLK